MTSSRWRPQRAAGRPDQRRRPEPEADSRPVEDVERRTGRSSSWAGSDGGGRLDVAMELERANWRAGLHRAPTLSRARAAARSTSSDSTDGADSAPGSPGPRGRADAQPGSAQGYTSGMAQAPALPSGFELPLEPSALRASAPSTRSRSRSAPPRSRRRSIKRESKLFALDLAVRMMDLTTLEGADTPGKVAALCSKAMRPDPADLTMPPVAAVCVYPNLVPHALERVRGSGVKVASVATALPVGPGADASSRSRRPRASPSSAPTRSTWSSTAARSSPAHYAKVYDEVGA